MEEQVAMLVAVALTFEVIAIAISVFLFKTFIASIYLAFIN